MENYNLSSQGGQQFFYQDLALQRTLMQRVFGWMALGLAITGLTSYLTFSSNLFFLIKDVFGILVIAELGLVWGISRMIDRISFSVATLLFGIYAILNGITLSYIFAIYEISSIASTFFITAGTFAAMAIIGYTTKRDLSKMGSILMMGLIGIIIASLVNLFLSNSMLHFIISIVGVLIFTGLTAYDTQKIKELFSGAYEDSEEVKKLSVLGALTLYLDFINLFLYLLRLLGRRDD